MDLEGTGMRLGFLGARECQTQNNFFEASRDSARPKNSILETCGDNLSIWMALGYA